MADLIWFDTHCHLQDEAFQDDRSEVFNRARANGVSYILLAASNLEDSKEALELALAHENVYCAMGYHPQDALAWDENSKENLLKLYRQAEKRAKELKRDNPIRAIGEIGLDYHWDTTPRDLQKYIYEEQIRLAAELHLPLIIHERDAFADSFAILKNASENQLLLEESGVCHCFSGSSESAAEVIKLGFLIGLDGPVTFKNAKKSKQIAKEIDLSKLLLETDSPYLTPEPHRGKRNESSYLPYIGKVIAELRGQDPAEIAKQTTENAKRLFSIR